MAALGLHIEAQDTPAEDADAGEVFHLWPESVPIWRLWFQLQTQWRTGVQGRDGLDYTGVCSYLREVARIKPRHFADTFACLQAMERAALGAWDKQHAANPST